MSVDEEGTFRTLVAKKTERVIDVGCGSSMSTRRKEWRCDYQRNKQQYTER